MSTFLGATLKYLFVCLSIILLTGCGSSPNILPNAANDTVNLSRGNYKIVKAGARGFSQGLVVLFIPLGMPSYADAKANLYQSLGQSVEGRSIALINQTADTGGLWLLVVYFPNITITAVVIEFNSSNSPNSYP